MIRVNLLGLPKRKKRAPAVTMEGRVPLVVLLVVLVLVGGWEYWRYGHLQQQGVELDLRIRELQAEKVRLEAIRAEYETVSKQTELLSKRIRIIEGLSARRSGPTQLLDTLASTVSKTNSLWLTGFEQVGQKITIEGIALNKRAVADFITHLIDSKAFSDVDLKETYQETGNEIPQFLFTVNAEQVAPPTS